MYKKLIMPSILIVAIAVISGCAAAESQVTPAPPTKTPKPTFTATADWTPTSVVFPTATPLPATNTPQVPPTPEATAVPPSPTPEPIARLTATQNVNVRSGPGTSYPVIGRLASGDTYEISGKNAAGDWLQFTINGQTGWVTSGLVTVSGDMNTVQVAAAPALPTARPQPTARPRPTAAPQPTQPPAPTVPSTPYIYVDGSMQTAPNCGTVYVRGKVVDGGGNAINGVAVELEFFGNTVIRVSGVGENPGEFGFSPLSPDYYKTAVPFRLRVVESQGNPSAQSPDFRISFVSCDQAGQFSNITFRKVR